MKRVRPRLPFSASLRMTCCLASSSRTWRDGTVHCVVHCLVHCVVHCVVRQVTQGLNRGSRTSPRPRCGQRVHKLLTCGALRWAANWPRRYSRKTSPKW